MPNDMVAIAPPPRFELRTPEDLRTQVNTVQHVMKAVMRDKTHYGVIPGTGANAKPTLYKAGSEILLSTFHIAVEPEVEDLSDGDHIRYRVKCHGRHQPSGVLVGTGVGEASTAEEKYCWRRAVCDEEFDETDPSKRRVQYKKWDNKVQKTKQIRTNPADLANTVLKMAKKRAQIDLCLTATAASDIFTQDVEDLPEELRESAAVDERPTEPRVKQPTAVATSTNTGAPDGADASKVLASPGMLKHIRTRLESAALSTEDLHARFSDVPPDWTGLTVKQANAILEWIINPGPAA